MAGHAVPIHVIQTSRVDDYDEKVVQTYDDDPQLWRKALGDNLSFQFGLFDDKDLAEPPTAGPVGPSEFRHFDRQLELAGLLGENRPTINRILDLGCGWGFITQRLAAHFIDCQHIDAINISQRQLEYCAENLPESLKSRVNLYLCNGQDVDSLPDQSFPYDLIVVRGVYTHFLHDVFEASVSQVAKRLSSSGVLVISDTLYNVPTTDYKSYIPDIADRLACGNRKSPAYFTSVLEKNGLTVQDSRVMPSNAEVIYWFEKVRLNIEEHFPDGVTGPIQELHEMAISFNKSLAKNKASVYSIVARRTTP